MEDENVLPISLMELYNQVCGLLPYLETYDIQVCYIACDSDGEVTGFLNQPYKEDGGWYEPTNKGNYVKLFELDKPVCDWYETIIDRSQLCTKVPKKIEDIKIMEVDK